MTAEREDVSGIVLMHPLFSLKLADIGKFCYICIVIYAGNLPIADKKKILDKIAKALNIKLRVEII